MRLGLGFVIAAFTLNSLVCRDQNLSLCIIVEHVLAQYNVADSGFANGGIQGLDIRLANTGNHRNGIENQYLHLWMREQANTWMRRSARRELSVPSRWCSTRGPYRTFHDLLYLHLQGDDLADRRLVGVVEVPFETVDRQGSVHHRRNVIVLQENHLVRVLNDGTVINGEKLWYSGGGGTSGRVLLTIRK